MMTKIRLSLIFALSTLGFLLCNAQVQPLEAIIPKEKEATKKQVLTPKPSKSDKITKKQDEKDDDASPIYLNFDNADLSNFINYMAELKGINLIPNTETAGVKISLTIREPLNVEEAWNVFQTVLEMGGFSIVQAGEVHKIVPKNTK
ncbi:hypothetical protein KAU11_01975, partial [Candidatus Babeliales bacterium]|nr:hypothetical protein [Candidatus Babeliales bacterium]